MKLGSLILNSHLIQGPLAGYSCAPFRELIWQYSTLGYCCTEMLSAKDLVTRKQQPKRYVWKSPKEGMLCFQLAGREPEILAQAVQRAEEYGADLIDLNCGCPKIKIRSKGLGSKLLEEVQLLETCVRAMVNAAQVPITVKIRLDSSSSKESTQEVAKRVEGAGASALIVHGRHWQDDYDVPCDLQSIKAISEGLSIPVIANGDVSCQESLEKTLTETQCPGVMVARATMGRPWLFKELTEPEFIKPSNKQIGAMLLQHVQGLIELENETVALLQARSFAKYYGRSAGVNQEFAEKTKQLHNFSQLKRLVSSYFL